MHGRKGSGISLVQWMPDPVAPVRILLAPFSTVAPIADYLHGRSSEADVQRCLKVRLVPVAAQL